MSDLGRFIKFKREDSGLSLKKLSSATGISDTEILKLKTVPARDPAGNIFVKLQQH